RVTENLPSGMPSSFTSAAFLSRTSPVSRSLPRMVTFCNWPDWARDLNPEYGTVLGPSANQRRVTASRMRPRAIHPPGAIGAGRGGGGRSARVGGTGWAAGRASRAGSSGPSDGTGRAVPFTLSESPDVRTGIRAKAGLWLRLFGGGFGQGGRARGRFRRRGR